MHNALELESWGWGTTLYGEYYSPFFYIVGEDFLPFSTSVDWDAMKILLSEALIE